MLHQREPLELVVFREVVEKKMGLAPEYAPDSTLLQSPYLLRDLRYLDMP
jgi:hypothetical protein